MSLFRDLSDFWRILMHHEHPGNASARQGCGCILVLTLALVVLAWAAMQGGG